MWSEEIYKSLDVRLKTNQMRSVRSQSRIGTSGSKVVLDLINQAGTNDFEAVRQLKKLQSNKVLASSNQNRYSTEELQQQFSKILVSMASHIKYEPIAMGEASLSNLKSIMTKQEQIDFKGRKIIFKKSKNKFPVYENPANNFYRLGRYLVEISVLKEKIYLFLLDESNQTRRFDARGDLLTTPDQLDNDGNTILLLQLWRKQIQYLFMEYYHK